MTPDEARELFSAASDATLARGEQHAFDEALAADAEVRDEYERFCKVVRATGELADDTGDVDLLPGLQARLRARSGGRYYRDRFAQERPSRSLAVLGASAVVLVLAIPWFAFDADLF